MILTSDAMFRVASDSSAGNKKRHIFRCQLRLAQLPGLPYNRRPFALSLRQRVRVRVPLADFLIS